MKRLLVVEDCIELREALVNQIDSWIDVEVVTAECGSDASTLLKADCKFDLVITDFCMPNGSGKDLLQMMVENKIDIPTLIYSGGIYGGFQNNDYKLCESYPNFKGFVEKPDFEKLRTSILELLKPEESKKNLPRPFGSS